MARLPEPILQEIAVQPPGDLKERSNSFYQILGQAISNRVMSEKKGGEKGKEKD